MSFKLGPTSSFWFLPVSTGVPNIWKLSFKGLLIYCDNFHFHCHSQLSLYKFSNADSLTHAQKTDISRGGTDPTKK